MGFFDFLRRSKPQEEGGEPVSACRLNLEHALVAEILARDEGEDAPPPADPAAPEPEETPEEEPTEAASPKVVTQQTSTYHSSVNGDDLGRPGESR